MNLGKVPWGGRGSLAKGWKIRCSEPKKEDGGWLISSKNADTFSSIWVGGNANTNQCEDGYRKPRLNRKTLFVLGAMNLIEPPLQKVFFRRGFKAYLCVGTLVPRIYERCILSWIENAIQIPSKIRSFGCNAATGTLQSFIPFFQQPKGTFFCLVRLSQLPKWGLHQRELVDTVCGHQAVKRGVGENAFLGCFLEFAKLKLYTISLRIIHEISYII